ncbi:MAG: glycosyltransferase [Clostridia bacterium]|nr:glycosyltransferase [Clostridia bacterium]
MQKDLISVIVPIYGIDKYVGLCIESILNQTYKNLEIILVDDGSPDRCPELCDLYAKKDPRIKVIHKLNGGLVSARKAGLLAATGTYVGYVDGDDWIGPGFYEALYTTAVTGQADMVCAGFTRDLFNQSAHFQNNVPLGIYTGDKLDNLRKQMISCGDFYKPGITTYVWNKLFKRDVLFDHQMNVDERISIGEDAAVTYPTLMKCNCVCVTDNYAYHYRQREDSMLKKSASFSEEAGKLQALYHYLADFAKKHPPEYEIEKQINEFVLGICIMRSGGIQSVHSSNHPYQPFMRPFQDTRVVIYSAGTFGQQLINRLKEQSYCSIVGWVDDDYWEYRRCCLDVDAVETITTKSFDYILVATVDSHLAKSIKERLLDLGISEYKILTVTHPQKDIGPLLKSFLMHGETNNE